METLCAHAEEVARLATGFAEVFGWAEVARALGLLHDAGKASAEFLARLRGAGGRVDPYDNTVDHCAEASNKLALPRPALTLGCANGRTGSDHRLFVRVGAKSRAARNQQH